MPYICIRNPVVNNINPNFIFYPINKMLLIDQKNQKLNIPIGSMLVGNSFKKIIVSQSEINSFNNDWEKYKNLILATRLFNLSDLIIK